MKAVLDIAVPIVAFLIMIPVGLELTVTAFRKLSHVPRMATAALVGQILQTEIWVGDKNACPVRSMNRKG